MSAGWQTSTGARVVGRSTPAGLTGARTRLLISVDFPAPVEPPTTASSGASRRPRRGRGYSTSWATIALPAVPADPAVGSGRTKRGGAAGGGRGVRGREKLEGRAAG